MTVAGDKSIWLIVNCIDVQKFEFFLKKIYFDSLYNINDITATAKLNK